MSIDDLTWGAIQILALNEEESLAIRKYKKASARILSKEYISYREIMTFPKQNDFGIFRIKRIKEIVEKNYYGYQLRYYDISHEGIPPLLQFMIIDSKEVILASHRGANIPIEGEPYLAVQIPDIVFWFQDYYNAIWHEAIIIKNAGTMANNQEINKIDERLHSNNT